MIRVGCDPLSQDLIRTGLPSCAGCPEIAENFRAIAHTDELFGWTALRPTFTRLAFCRDRGADRLVATALDNNRFIPLPPFFCRQRPVFTRRRSDDCLPVLMFADVLLAFPFVPRWHPDSVATKNSPSKGESNFRVRRA